MENTVLLVDDERNILNSLTRVFRKDGYNILTAEGGAEGLELIKANKVSIVISDHRMPVMEGVEFLSRVKEASPETIRFMLTGYADIKAVMSAINKGEVYRYITKPWNDDELRSAVREALEHYNLSAENRRLTELTKIQNAQLVDLNKNLESKVEQKTRKIRENFFAFVKIFSNLMELFDQGVGGHSKRVGAMSRAMVLRMRFDEVDADLIETAALLHNIGLIGIPKDLLERDEDSLSEDEKALLSHNPALSQDILSQIDTFRQAGIIIRGQMERFDGRGCPDGLKKEEIHIGSRILAVCKAYDTLKNGRRKLPLSEVVLWLKDESGTRFDPEVVDEFIGLLGEWREDEIGGRTSNQKGAYERISIMEMRNGMVLAGPIVTNKGRLLVTKGTVLTEVLIDKVLKFHQIDPIIDHISIVPKNHGQGGHANGSAVRR